MFYLKPIDIIYYGYIFLDNLELTVMIFIFSSVYNLSNIYYMWKSALKHTINFRIKSSDTYFFYSV